MPRRRDPGEFKPLALYHAFGEAKTPKEWAADYRCVVGHGTLLSRLSQGWPIEAALVLSPQETVFKHAAFGEKKTLLEWLIDPRCQVTASILLGRLAGGISFQSALTKKALNTQAEQPKEKLREERSKPSEKKVFEAFGEKRHLAEWATDRRCAVSYGALKTRVTKYEMEVEAAILFSMDDLNAVYTFQDRRQNLGNWLRELKVAIPFEVLKRRLDSGESLSLILSGTDEEPDSVEGPGQRRVAPRPREATRGPITRSHAQQYEAFGEAKTLHEWALDPRCEVLENTLRQRVTAGKPLSAALLRDVPAEYSGHPKYEGFGESKTLAAWLSDERCRVTRTALMSRLKKGYRLEEALTIKRHDRSLSKSAQDS